MPTSKNKKLVPIDRELLDRFEYVYPRVKSTFIYRALFLALQDKKFFEDVFFNSQFLEVK